MRRPAANRRWSARAAGMSIDAMFRQANAAQMAGNFADAERRYRALARLKPLWA